MEGLRFNEYPIIRVKGAKAKKGISNILPASAYFMLNLTTIN